MLSFWAGGISSFPPCAREYRLLRRLPLATPLTPSPVCSKHMFEEMYLTMKYIPNILSAIKLGSVGQSWVNFTLDQANWLLNNWPQDLRMLLEIISNINYI